MVGTPDEETLAAMGSEKACAYMRTLPTHPPKDLATVLPEADPLGQYHSSFGSDPLIPSSRLSPPTALLLSQISY
jgi:hypothetical protein